ncbi:MAG: T9SS type A sorting domain-containing protein [Bacteroidia bacterium]|nr:T9SS type A sorting domain-containing protein [Bacteroidia bacterium]
MKKKLKQQHLLNVLIFTFSFAGISQNTMPIINIPLERTTKNAAIKSEPLVAEFIGFRKPSLENKDWRPYLYSIVSENSSPKNELLKRIQKELDERKLNDKLSNKVGELNEVATATIAPVMGTNFIGIDNGGSNSPLDNTMAVSNGGYIVACVNSRIEYDDVLGNFYGGQTLVNLINVSTISTNLCDPKVIYDSGSDRFVLFVQTCDGVSSSSKVILGFSKTNNPLNGWYFYVLTGNPLNDNSWFDYPKMAVSNSELFITGNLFDNAGNFKQSVIYQIGKANGYAGGSISWQHWTNISGSPFTILPVSWGQQGNYGPGIYLVASEAPTSGSTNIDLYEIDLPMTSSTEQLTHYNIPTTLYSTAGNAAQLGSSLILKAGDNRTMSGYYLNGIIHFVFHSNIGGGYNGINYNRLNVATGTNISSTFGLSGTYEYCYPAIASIGATTSDKSAIIAFSRSGASIYPEVRAIAVDDQMNWSNSILVKGGENFVDYSWTTTSDERWGDYSGISRKYNSNPPTVWLSGDYASSSNYWNQWIAEISVVSTIGLPELSKGDKINASIYPNPIIETYKIEFEIPKRIPIQINITDLQGKVIKELYSGNSFEGKNLFSFNKAQLPAGLYFINIVTNNKILKNEKIIIADK